MRPAAEDGVRETGAAFGAPHQLHQLFSQFGHDGVPASGSSLSGLLPRNMGKGRLRRQEVRDGGGEGAGRLDARKTKGDRATCRDRACQASPSGSKEFPVPEVPSHFRLPFCYRPSRREDPGVTSPEAEVGGRKGFGDLCSRPAFWSSPRAFGAVLVSE